MNNLVANLIVFVLLGGVLIFIISVVIHSRRMEKEEKGQKALNTKSKDGNK